ncbi:hypothetical protein F4678DRAFT_429653 [Xylaria arbuscula]|nr:hypothetical protein F4678DRAFT_429653 [Xylaria arbuscula]
MSCMLDTRSASHSDLSPIVIVTVTFVGTVIVIMIYRAFGLTETREVMCVRRSHNGFLERLTARRSAGAGIYCTYSTPVCMYVDFVAFVRLIWLYRAAFTRTRYCMSVCLFICLRCRYRTYLTLLPHASTAELDSVAETGG